MNIVDNRLIRDNQGSIAVKEFVEWDVHNWSRALHYWQAHGQVQAGGEALEVGSRNGGLSLWLAEQAMNVLCTDVNGPTEQARQLHARHQLANRIQYAELNCLSIGYENRFDVVVFKSVLGGIGAGDDFARMELALKQVHKALKPGGRLLFAENLQGLPLYRFLRSRFIEWNDDWCYLSLHQLVSMLSGFTSVKCATAGVTSLLGRNETQRNILGVLDHAVLERLLPSNWRSIAFGVATK